MDVTVETLEAFGRSALLTPGGLGAPPKARVPR